MNDQIFIMTVPEALKGVRNTKVMVSMPRDCMNR